MAKDKKQKKTKKISLNLPKEVIEKIPYKKIYKDTNIIETENGIFTKTYILGKMDYDKIKDMDLDRYLHRFSELLNAFDDDITLQFTIHNKQADAGDFLSAYRLNNRSDGLDNHRNDYNSILEENFSKGKNNNVKKDRFFTVAVPADFIDDACIRFSEIDKKVLIYFGKCEIEVHELPLVERLKVLYNMYNTGKEKLFGSKAIIKGRDDKFTLENMKAMKFTSKDIVGPSEIIVKPEYLQFGDKFIRTMYLHNIPSYISENMISDLIGSSNNMITSIYYKPIGLEDEKLYLDNTVLSSKKNKGMTKAQIVLKRIANKGIDNDYEKKYFDELATAAVKDALTETSKMFLNTVVITLIADTLEELDINSKGLMVSATKYLCQIRCLTNQQLQGFNTALPLCNNFVHLERCLKPEKIQKMLPLNIQDLSKTNGLLYGTNTINSNLVLHNRKNSPECPFGFVLGKEHIGKTVAIKQEITNTLLSSNDTVIVVTDSEEYNNFATALKGVVLKDSPINPVTTVKGYANQDKESVLKSKYFNALISSIKEDRYGLTYEEQSCVDDLVQYMENKNYSLTIPDLVQYLDEKGLVGEKIAEYLRRIPEKFKGVTSKFPGNKLVILNTKNSPVDMCATLDFVWNITLMLFMRSFKENNTTNKRTWIYIDNIDTMFSTEELSLYMKELFIRSKSCNGIITGSTQNTSTLLQSEDAKQLIETASYNYLLCLEPQDRETIIALCNIPKLLIPYISEDTEGSGLIITTSSNIPCNSIITKENRLNLMIN